MEYISKFVVVGALFMSNSCFGIQLESSLRGSLVEKLQSCHSAGDNCDGSFAAPQCCARWICTIDSTSINTLVSAVGDVVGIAGLFNQQDTSTKSKWAWDTGYCTVPSNPDDCGISQVTSGDTILSKGDCQTQFLKSGSSIYSNDGCHRLSMQSDGNLVLYKQQQCGGKQIATWSMQAKKYDGSSSGCAMLVRGSLVVSATCNNNDIITSFTQVVASTESSSGNYPVKAVVQNDGNFVIYDASNRAIWSSGTNGH